MKRDMDLCRKILLKLENFPSPEEIKGKFGVIDFDAKEGEAIKAKDFFETRGGFISFIKDSIYYEGYSKEEVSFNVALLAEGGLIVAADNRSMELINSWTPIRLTWEGYEFLDAARDNKNWERAKKAAEKAGGFTLDVLKELLVQYIKVELKLQ